MVGANGYNVKRAAQAAAYFALKSGGRINVLKLSKLMYLAEREFMDRFDEPMFYDRLVSMDHGPVTSITLDLINGMTNVPDEWSKFVSARSGYDVCINSEELNTSDLKELSRADLSVLGELWEKLGDLDGFQLRNYTHEHCPEWENPNGSSAPISHESVFKFLKKENAELLAEEVSDYRILSKKLASF